MEDTMTLYINPVRRNTRRRAIEEIMRDWDDDYSAMISFPIDIVADSDGYTIKALLPGVKPEDLDIQIVNEIVTISGSLDADRKEDENYLLAERPSGTFHRVLTLPTPLDSSKVEASLADGVLTLDVPKTEEAKPRTIKVNQK
jgi:HSP20 family protein